MTNDAGSESMMMMTIGSSFSWREEGWLDGISWSLEAPRSFSVCHSFITHLNPDDDDYYYWYHDGEWWWWWAEYGGLWDSGHPMGSRQALTGPDVHLDGPLMNEPLYQWRGINWEKGVLGVSFPLIHSNRKKGDWDSIDAIPLDHDPAWWWALWGLIMNQ